MSSSPPPVLMLLCSLPSSSLLTCQSSFVFLVLFFIPVFFLITSSYLLQGTATVTVTITDANDEAPVFTMPSYSVIINETIAGSPSSSNVIISSVGATDADEPSTAASTVSYRIDDPRARGWFGVDPTSVSSEMYCTVLHVEPIHYTQTRACTG